MTEGVAGKAMKAMMASVTTEVVKGYVAVPWLCGNARMYWCALTAEPR